MAPNTSDADISALPTPSHLTLLCKSHKHTILLSVLPSTSLATIKSQLLSALQSRDITQIAHTPVPSDANEIELGVLADKRDVSKGWVPLWLREQEIADGKGGKKKVGGKKSVFNEGVEGAGLGDGSWVAFRFREVGRQAEHAKRANGEDEGDELDVEMGGEEDPGWDVVLPTYEEDGE